MKRFILFEGSSYYASGGALDLSGHFDTVEDAKKAVTAVDDYGYDWWHIFDTQEMKLADYKRGSYCGTSYHMGEEAFKKMQGEDPEKPDELL